MSIEKHTSTKAFIGVFRLPFTPIDKHRVTPSSFFGNNFCCHVGNKDQLILIKLGCFPTVLEKNLTTVVVKIHHEVPISSWVNRLIVNNGNRFTFLRIRGVEHRDVLPRMEDFDGLLNGFTEIQKVFYEGIDFCISHRRKYFERLRVLVDDLIDQVEWVFVPLFELSELFIVDVILVHHR